METREFFGRSFEGPGMVEVMSIEENELAAREIRNRLTLLLGGRY